MVRQFATTALAVLLASACALSATKSEAGVKWPAGQLLPTLSTPASTLDLISLSIGHSLPAASPKFTHATGHKHGRGWLCIPGVDTAGVMIGGSFDTSFPVGPNSATFRMKIDDVSPNDDAVCTVDIVDNATNAVLATQTITRRQFADAAGSADPHHFEGISVDFTTAAVANTIGFRLHWPGTSRLEVKNISINGAQRSEAAVLFSSLQGLVNRTRPRIYSYDDNTLNQDGKYTWLHNLGLGYHDVADNWTLIAKYRHEIKGIVVYDDRLPDTINLASTIAAQKHALVASPLLLSKLTAAPYRLPVLVDLRGKYTDRLAVYQDLYDTYWPHSTHRVLVGLNPHAQYGAAREYAAAIDSAVVWLDPRVPAESDLLNKFLASMGSGSPLLGRGGIYMGWWPDEQSGVAAASAYGIATCASDWSTDLSVFSGTSRTVDIKPAPPAPPAQNKIYLAFIVSDGDNLQYIEHKLPVLWNDPGRGKIPLGWTLSPTMLDAMPGVLNYLYKSSTANDCLLSGPSGYGYTYPNFWKDTDALNHYIAKSNDYCNRAGFKIITVWNTINGAIDPAVGSAYAIHAPSLLGLTAQNAGGGLTVYGNSLPSMAFAANYCPTIVSVRKEIRNNSKGWTGASPRFLLLQVQPWGDITPTRLAKVVRSLGSEYTVIRPDTMFEMIRDTQKLPGSLARR